MTKKCIVPGCVHTHVSNCSFFNFPVGNNRNNIQRIYEWIKNIGNRELVSLSSRSLMSRRVCSCHFESTQFKPSSARKLLSSTAIPSKLLPADPISDEKMTEFVERRNILQTTPVMVPLTRKEFESLAGGSANNVSGSSLNRSEKIREQHERDTFITDHDYFGSISSSDIGMEEGELDTNSVPATFSTGSSFMDSNLPVSIPIDEA